ncbi:MAG: acetyl-CoA C-acetyltransferase [candidate division Zixibacteria bacterium]|nr:acetyl-CoA C-acetyltransferase [candidate division Zixibacteria bacterium]
MADEIVVLNGARTPFGEFGGSLRGLSATELGVVAASEAIQRSGIKREWIDQVVFGNVMQTSGDAIYFARHIGLKCGLPQSVPALTVNRLCGSGLEALVCGTRLIKTGEAEFVLVGGAESMSQAPHVIRGARWGLDLGKGQMEDSLWVALVDSYNNLGMANTAENLAERYKISREACDEFAYTSQMRAVAARKKCYLSEEIVPVEVKGRKGDVSLVDKDEHIRPDTTLEGLAKLRAVFKKDGVVTAGNASGINDGAGALILTSKAKAKELNLPYLGKVIAWSAVGVDPDVMGIGPADAIRTLLKKARVNLDEVDLFEINEAFAAQYLAVEKELELPRDRTNVNGGAVALGHPLAASGARLSLTLLMEMKRRKSHYGIASLCIGGGQGIACLFEREKEN